MSLSARVIDVKDSEDVGEEKQSPMMNHVSMYYPTFRLPQNSPLKSSDSDQCLQAVAAAVGASTGTGDLSCHGNPATEPETHGDDLDEGDDIFVGVTRRDDRCHAEVGDRDDGGPAAVEEHVVDGV